MQSNRPTLNPQNKRIVNLKTNKIKNSEIIASQPGKTTWTFRNDWEFGFCNAGCGSHDCCYACCCLPCYIAHLATMTKETTCIVCCVPLALMQLRTKIRTLLRINVN